MADPTAYAFAVYSEQFCLFCSCSHPFLVMHLLGNILFIKYPFTVINKNSVILNTTIRQVPVFVVLLR